MVFDATFQPYFSYIMVVSCIGRGTQSTQFCVQSCKKVLLSSRWLKTLQIEIIFKSINWLLG
jgi:hypothetical protein